MDVLLYDTDRYQNNAEREETMITFNTTETLTFNIGINLFSMILTIFILKMYQESFTDTYEILLLRKIQKGIILIFATDILMWALNGQPSLGVRIINYLNITIYFLMQLLVILFWLRYAHYRLFNRVLRKKHELVLILLPFLGMGLIVLTTAFTGWCFYLDNQNFFYRGPLSTPLSFVLLVYLLSVSVLAFLKAVNHPLVERKDELMTIAFFSLPPLIGGLLQTIFYGMSFVWPSAVLSSLLVLLNKLGQAMSRDSLTGLNNRNTIDRYFASYPSGLVTEITLILLDINGFKEINDQHGHIAGDLALVEMAKILRKTFNKTSAFISRYGGDEFLVILPSNDEKIAQETIQQIKNNIQRFNQITTHPFQLSISAGHGVSSKAMHHHTDILKQADENMYKDKENYTKVQATYPVMTAKKQDS